MVTKAFRSGSSEGTQIPPRPSLVVMTPPWRISSNGQVGPGGTRGDAAAERLGHPPDDDGGEPREHDAAGEAAVLDEVHEHEGMELRRGHEAALAVHGGGTVGRAVDGDAEVDLGLPRHVLEVVEPGLHHLGVGAAEVVHGVPVDLDDAHAQGAEQGGGVAARRAVHGSTMQSRRASRMRRASTIDAIWARNGPTLSSSVNGPCASPSSWDTRSSMAPASSRPMAEESLFDTVADVRDDVHVIIYRSGAYMCWAHR